MTDRAVRIVGCGALTGAGRGLESFFRAMRAATPGQAEASLGDTRLTPRYVRIEAPREPLADRGADLASTWASMAVDDAWAEAAPRLRRAPTRVVLLGGSSLGGMTGFETRHRQLFGQGPERDCGPGLPTLAASPALRAYDGPTAAVAARGIGGRAVASLTLNTACSSAANALGLARRLLLADRADAVVVVGFDVISPFVYAGFSVLKAVDPQPSAPFGAERQGLNLGEAAVALVLTLPGATTGGLVDLVGFGSSCDAHHLTRPDPQGGGLARAIHAALRDAEAHPTDVGAVSAHGTGTPLNDPMEDQAFTKVFGADVPPIHCAKPVAGHTLGAAGAIDALLVHEALRAGVWPKSFGRGADDPALAHHPSRAELPLGRDALVLSTSSGFGGSNAALLLRGVANDGSRP